jgi:hypothetical protein
MLKNEVVSQKEKKIKKFGKEVYWIFFLLMVLTRLLSFFLFNYVKRKYKSKSAPFVNKNKTG